MSGKKLAMGKMRPASEPYLTVQNGPWEWRVLKAYQDPNKPFARAHCLVRSPFADDQGDVYWADIRGHIVEKDPLVTSSDLPHHLWPALQEYYDERPELVALIRESFR